MAMAEVGTWIIDTGLEAVGPVAEAVRALALPVLGEEGAGDLELALTEAVTNVIRHGYGPEGGPVRVEAEVQGRQVPGEALAGAGLHRFDFDPEDIEGLPAGGMGLSLITVLMDEVSYRTDLGQNRLTLLRGPRD